VLINLSNFSEKIQREDEVTDDESGSEGVMLSDEHNTLLKLASQTKRGTDLTRITLPTFLIEPKSFLEVLANFWNHTNLFIKYTIV
jgi:Oxysterol-binding protein